MSDDYCHLGFAGSFFFGVIPNAAAARENIEDDVFPPPPLPPDENNDDLDTERNIDDADEGLLAAVAARSVAAPEEKGFRLDAALWSVGHVG